jgi:hypothetical protein
LPPDTFLSQLYPLTVLKIYLLKIHFDVMEFIFCITYDCNLRSFFTKFEDIFYFPHPGTCTTPASPNNIAQYVKIKENPRVQIRGYYQFFD